MSFSSWICTNNSKTMLLRIVHPGGRVEIHDRPVIAAEIMCRNPRCCVAYPYVFQQPWAVVPPDTMLMLGQKFYVVPISTVRKLQRLSPRHSPSPARDIKINSSSVHEVRSFQSDKEEEDDGMISICCAFRNNSKKHSRNKRERSEIRMKTRNLNQNFNDNNVDLSYDNCFMSLFTGVVTKANVSEMTKEPRTSSSSTEVCDSDTLTRKRTQDHMGHGLRGSPKKLFSSEQWQPSLESITEE